MKPLTSIQNISRCWLRRVVLLCCIAVTTLSGYAQEERDQMLERIYKKLQQYQASSSGIESVGYLTGLWNTKQSEDADNLRHILHYNDILIYYMVDKATGTTTMSGFAENINGRWSGWWQLSCRGCCPGVGWWDKGILEVIRPGIKLNVTTFKMDPASCELTTMPDHISVDLDLLNVVSFKDISPAHPGKKIHIIAAPQVGSQQSQYKAAVTIQWQFQGLGVSHVDVAIMGGGMPVDNSRYLNGEYQFVTDKSGEYKFIVIGYNNRDHPLHFEIRSITIPSIPGIGG